VYVLYAYGSCDSLGIFISYPEQPGYTINSRIIWEELWENQEIVGYIRSKRTLRKDEVPWKNLMDGKSIHFYVDPEQHINV
jgi:hypothetical protein